MHSPSVLPYCPMLHGSDARRKRQKSVPESRTRHVDFSCGSCSSFLRRESNGQKDKLGLSRSYAGITQIRYKGQYLLGIQSQPALLPAPPGGMNLSGCFAVIIAVNERAVQPERLRRRIRFAFFHSGTYYMYIIISARNRATRRLPPSASSEEA